MEIEQIKKLNIDPDFTTQVIDLTDKVNELVDIINEIRAIQ